MFIYQGKLTWLQNAKNETFTIVFPKDEVRANDSVYLFTQWTKDAQGVEKAKFFQTIVVSDLKKLDGGNISFTLASSSYDYTITTQEAYSKIKVDMSNRAGGKTSTILKRGWHSEGKIDPEAAIRIWAGSINWGDRAIDEQAIFILPEGYTDDKPIVSCWQFTKDYSGNPKGPVIEGRSLKVIGLEDKIAKFAFNVHADITCAWNQENEILVVDVKEPDGKQLNIGKLNLFAKIEPQSHSFETEDLSPPVEKKVELRYPQPQATLQRVLEPLPFPKTLIETLTHGAAFIEQAGYLTKQAQNKFNELHEDFHEQTILVESLKKHKENLEKQIITVTDERNTANENVKEINKQISLLNNEYKNKVRELEAMIAGWKKEDDKDHKVINKLKEDISKLHHKNMELLEKLSKAEIAHKKLGVDLAASQARVRSLEATKLTLQNSLAVSNAQNVSYRSQIDALNKKLHKADDANKELQKSLAKAEQETKDTKAKLSAKQKDLDRANNDHGETRKKLEIAEKTRDATEAARKAAVTEAEAQKKKAEISDKLTALAKADFSRSVKEGEDANDKARADSKRAFAAEARANIAEDEINKQRKTIKGYVALVDRLEELVVREPVNNNWWQEFEPEFKRLAAPA
ncbi:hypothetical protein FHETE_10607 [Fusarium heterosporum]|uniref:Uncharacterized protein n=1 Tax=Fusarium heterosporum TaxID=42747 RepID=A0A8H5SUP8_FUSHE|nr:hypothetical protein FHETE_10607 [Fusarium heterosporum]